MFTRSLAPYSLVACPEPCISRRSLHGNVFGTIPMAHNLKLNILSGSTSCKELELPFLPSPLPLWYKYSFISGLVDLFHTLQNCFCLNFCSSHSFLYSTRGLVVMHSVFCFWAIALPITALLGLVTGVRIPVDEVYRRNQFAVKQHMIKRDLKCIENDILLSLQQYPEDSIPFCSNYIGIPAQTALSTITTKTLDTIRKVKNAFANAP